MKPLSTARRVQVVAALVEGNSNFCRRHQTIKTTPTIAAKLTDHVVTLEELVALLGVNNHNP
jgi:hypothetical protein